MIKEKCKIFFCFFFSVDESKTLTKHISCECKCEFDGKKM